MKIHFEPVDLESFKREATLLAGITHPRVIRVFDAGEVEVDGRRLAYMSMEHLPLGSLALLLRDDRRLPVNEALDVTRQVLEAVQYFQALDPPVVHRDLIPDNVFVAARTPIAIKVGDFSLARPVLESLGMTDLGDSVIDYLPPESALGYFPSTGDLYAVGIMLYRMLTGILPFPPISLQRRQRMRDLLKDRRTPPLPPSAIWSRIDPGIDGLVMRALAPNPTDRFPDAAAFAAATSAVSYH